MRSIITFALTAVLVITFASCGDVKRNNPHLLDIVANVQYGETHAYSEWYGRYWEVFHSDDSNNFCALTACISESSFDSITTLINEEYGEYLYNDKSAPRELICDTCALWIGTKDYTKYYYWVIDTLGIMWGLMETESGMRKACLELRFIPRPQFVCYYGCSEHSFMYNDSIKHNFQIFRDIECPLPVNEAWAKIRADILIGYFYDSSRAGVSSIIPLKTLKEYPHVVAKDTEPSDVYQHSNYASRRTFYLGDYLYCSYLHWRRYIWKRYAYEGYFYQYYNTLTGNRLLIGDLLSNDSAVTRYLDSTIRQSDLACGILVDTIRQNNNFIISDNGLTFVYNQYEIGGNPTDTVMCTVPLSVFKPYIRTQWKHLWK